MALLALISGPAGVAVAVAISADFTWSGVHVGCALTMSATAPDTTPVAIEVPPIWKYPPPNMQDGHSVSNRLDGAASEMRCAPGATTSGLAKPSCVVPRLDQSASMSSFVDVVPCSSVPPTVITNGSLAGA